MHQTILRLLVVTLLLFGASACKKDSPKPASMKAQIVAGGQINPDRNGRAKPVVVRVYQLKTAGTFDGADFFALYRDADATLAADKLSVQELMIQPGQTQTLDAEFDPEARVVGVIAAFRDIENAVWRQSVELPEDKLIKFFDKRQMIITLEDRSINLQFAKPGN